MAVNDLQCPNCGAPVDFAGSTQAACSFCQSKLYFTSEGVKGEAIERGEMPVVTADQRRSGLKAPTRSRGASISGWLGCLPILLLVGLSWGRSLRAAPAAAIRLRRRIAVCRCTAQAQRYVAS